MAYVSASDDFGHILTKAGEQLARSLVEEDSARIIDGRPSTILLNRSTIIKTFTYEELTDPNLSFTANFDLVNENKIGFSLTGNGSAITLSIEALDSNGNAWTSQDGITQLNGQGYLNFNQLDPIRRQWLLFDYDLVILERYNHYEDLGNTNYSMGIGLIPKAAETGVTYPTQYTIDYTDTAFPYLIAPIFNDTSSDQTFDAVQEFLLGSTYMDIEYDDGDDSETGGGGGSYTSINNAMNFPELPSLSAISTGFIALYAPTAAQLSDIADWLWSPNFYDAIIKNYSDPFNNILGLWISPVVPNTLGSQLRVGNVASGITANKVSDQYGKRNCGRLAVSKYYNSFADYENYRQFKMFLPYYGIVDISTDDFIGGTLEVEYNIDYLTGTAAIHIRSNRNGTPHIINSYTCNLYASVPFSGQNMMSYYQSIANGILQVGGGIAASNPMSMANGVIDIVGAKPNYAHSSGMGANSGLLGIQYPYLIECRSIRDMPSKYNYNEGVPLNKTYTLSQLSGYTEVEAINVKIPHAADSINNKIEELLKEGVIL